jgi:hypothetical protein
VNISNQFSSGTRIFSNPVAADAALRAFTREVRESLTDLDVLKRQLRTACGFAFFFQRQNRR